MSTPKLALLALFALGPLALQDTETKKADPAELAKLQWLAGTWEMKKGAQTTIEHWMPLAGTSMIGLSHTYDDTQTREFEFLRITFQHGRVAYVAQPGGAPPVPFLATTLTDREAVFDNPTHDYPQRIRYERTDTGMTATISLLDGARAASFPFTRLAD